MRRRRGKNEMRRRRNGKTNGASRVIFCGWILRIDLLNKKY
jgi:hypothetical protein